MILEAIFLVSSTLAVLAATCAVYEVLYKSKQAPDTYETVFFGFLILATAFFVGYTISFFATQLR